MPTNTTEAQAAGMAAAIVKVQGDLFGIDPTMRLEAKAKLQRSSKWLRDLRQSHAEAAAELLTLNTIAAKDCFARRDFEGLARHSALVLQYTLPRLNAVVIPGANGQSGPMVVQWGSAPADDSDPQTVEG